MEKNNPYEKIFDLEEIGTPLETSGAWEPVINGAAFEDEEDLIQFIENKNVLDVGSGMGGLKKEAELKGINSNIISINPRFKMEGHKNLANEIFTEMFLERNTDISRENLEKATKKHDENAISAFSNNLPIKTGSIDAIIDNKGAIYHSIYEGHFSEFEEETLYNLNEDVLNNTLKEYIRVLRNKGEIRIGGLLKEPKEGIEYIKNKLEKISNITYRIIESPRDMDKENLAINIIKNE